MLKRTSSGDCKSGITKRFSSYFLALSALLLSPSVSPAGQSNYVTGSPVIAPVYGTAPSKGAVVVDAKTGATLERKSDYTEMVPASNRSMIVYSRFSPTNSSNEYILVHGDNSTSAHIYRISDNVKVASLTYNGKTTIGELNEIRWDYTGEHPYRVYFVVGKKFYQMDVLKENGAATLIRDFTADFPEGSMIANDVEGDSSNDSRYWAWQVLDKAYSPYATRLIFTYDKETNTILGVLRPGDVGYQTVMPRPNMVEISPLGSKVITHYGAASTHPCLLSGQWVSVGNGVWEFTGYKAQTASNSAFGSVTANGVPLAKMSTSSGSATSITGDNQYANNSTLDKFWIRITGGADPNGQSIVADWGVRPADVGTVLDAPRAWDLNFTKPVVISVNETHSGWAFDAAGREWFVSQNNKTDWIEARDILTGQAMNILYHGNLGWSNGFHFGKFYDQSQRGWLMMSTYSKLTTEWGNNQAMMVELKPASENPTIWRIAPLYNQYAGNYRDEGAVALGYDGKSILWTANWGSANGHGEVYYTPLPGDWYEHFPGTLHPDTTAPIVVSFSVPSSVTVLTVPVQEFTATDSVGVAGYLVTESAAVPSADASGWTVTAPTSYTFATAGQKTLYAWAKDAAGNVSKCRTASVQAVIAPQVTLSFPQNGAVGGTVMLNVAASGEVAVNKVELYIDGTLQGTATTAPYSFTWDTKAVANTTHTVSATATDAAGNVGRSADIAVTVFNDIVPPDVAVISPAPQSVVRGEVTIAATATDKDSSIAKVEFYLDGVLQQTVATAPYQIVWDTRNDVNRHYLLTVKAIDTAGNAAASDVQLVVDNDVTAPMVTLNQLDGKVTTETVTISGTVSDNVAVAKVAAQVGSQPAVDATVSGQVWSCRIANLVSGVNMVAVTATDTSGNLSRLTFKVMRH